MTLTIRSWSRRVVWPTDWLKSMFPVPAVSVRSSLPSTVLLKVMFPALLPVVRSTAPVRVTAEL